MSSLLAACLPWVEALGRTLLHFLWQGLVICAAYAALRARLGKERCDARYAAGLAALALLALCPLLTFIVLYGSPASVDAVASGVGEVAATSSAAVGGTAADVGGFDLDRVLPWLVLAWGLGVLLMAGRALHQWRMLARVVKRQAWPAVELEGMLAVLARRFGLTRRVRLLVSACIDTPTLIGWVRPVILLPTAVALGFPREQLELILAHELGHLRRYDHLVNLAQALLETLLFYHPVVHWISREVRNEREICCDALVLRRTAGAPHEYARALAGLEELRQPPAQLALAASGGLLLDRVRRIVGMPAPRPTGRRSRPGLWLLAAASLTLTVALALRSGSHEIELGGPGMTVDWPSEARMPLAVPALPPPERPHLRLASAEPMPARALATAEPPSARPPVADIAAVADPGGRPVEVAAAEPSPAVAPAHSRVDLLGADVLRNIADVPVAEPAVAAPPPPVVAPAPVASRIVAPEYPGFVQGRRPHRIELGFRIAADGAVRDITVIGGDASSAFARAAERALRQWRFKTATVPADRSARYSQTFVFEPPQNQRGVAADESGCITATGSHICRRPVDAAAAPGTTLAAWSGL